jgi:thiamine-phosphate diphosphorylase
MNEIAHKKSRLQFITYQWGSLSIGRQVEEAARGGCGWIQLRLKDATENQWLETLEQVKPLCHRYGAFLIINDHVEMAMKVGADGVHLGRHDMCPAKARELLGRQSIIGATANTAEQVLEAHEKGADYAGVGPFRNTDTKQRLAPVLQLEGYRHIAGELKKRNINLPVVAIGGIQSGDIVPLMRTGIHGIAVSSAAARAPEPGKWIQHSLHQINKEAGHDQVIR